MATEPEHVLQPPTTDSAEMSQVAVAAPTQAVTSPKDTTNIMPLEADNTSDSIEVQISETLRALSLSGNDGKENGVQAEKDASDSAAAKALVRRLSRCVPGPFIDRFQTAKSDAESKDVEDADAAPVPEAPAKPAPEPFAQQLQQMAVDPVDQPDPRLIDALENARDRIFVIKLEKEFIAFVNDER